MEGKESSDPETSVTGVVRRVVSPDTNSGGVP